MFEILDRPHVDPTSLPLTHSAWPICTIVGVYLVFVLWLGRKIMENREPYKLRGALRVYNLVQIVYNGALFIMVTYTMTIVKEYNFKCLDVLPLDHPMKNYERFLTYAYYLNKILDLMDTIFMVLRKTYKQISVLHLVHHVYMALATYFIIRLNGYGGPFIVVGYLNLFVHTVMYSYYYLSSQHASIKRSTWWKKYITILQMVQFVLLFIQTLWTYFQPDCHISIYIISLCLFMSALMFVMFSNFYIHTYILPKKNNKQK